MEIKISNFQDPNPYNHDDMVVSQDTCHVDSLLTLRIRPNFSQRRVRRDLTLKQATELRDILTFMLERL